MEEAWTRGNSTVNEYASAGSWWQGMTEGWVSDMALIAGLVTAFASYLWIFRWKQRNDVGPKTWPILGSYLELNANKHRLYDWLTDYIKKSPTGTIFTMVLGNPIAVTCNPESVEFILKKNFSNFPKGYLLRERVVELLGNGIFAADGEAWRQHRKIASYEFSSRKLRGFSTAVYREHALRLAHMLGTFATTQTQLDFQDLALRMTMDSICKIGFGVEFESLSPSLPNAAFSTAFDNATAGIMKRQFGLLWKLLRLFNLGSEAQLRKDINMLNAFIKSIIDQRRIEMLAVEKAGEESKGNDLLTRFMTTRDEEDNSLSDTVLRDAILSFIIAGRDTTAITLSWFIYSLCKNPEVNEKCYEELKTILPDSALTDNESFEDFAELLTFETLEKLQYLHAALSETLRIYPVVPKDNKFSLTACVLPDGTAIPKHTQIAYFPYGMGRMESLWGSDYDQFRPERWIKDGYFQPESPFKFTAFQAGPRICLGKEAAYIQMKMTAALLIRFYRFQVVPGHPIEYRPSLVMPFKYGLKVTVSKR